MMTVIIKYVTHKSLDITDPVIGISIRRNRSFFAVKTICAIMEPSKSSYDSIQPSSHMVPATTATTRQLVIFF